MLKILNSTTFLSEKAVNMVPDTAFTLGTWEVKQTVVVAAMVTLILIVFAICLRIFAIPKWEKAEKPKGFQMTIEGLINMFDSNAHHAVGHNAKFISPVYFGLAAFIFMGIMIEMLGFRPPISDLNVTLALGLSTFIMINIFGIKEKKWKRPLRYANPIHIVTDGVIPFSMALRLFGSVFSGYLIMHMIYGLPWFARIAIPAVASIMFTVFHAFIQSYIFMMLSVNFIAEATE